jgi:hypothetical protein
MRDLDGNEVDWTSLIDNGLGALRACGDQANSQTVATRGPR